MTIEEDLVARVDRLLEKGMSVLATKRHYPNLHSNFVDYSGAVEWQTQVLNFLTNLVGSEGVYTTEFRAAYGSPGNPTLIEGGLGILRAVREDINNGQLTTNLRTLLSAEIFSDFLDMAEHLLECSYKDPAASLNGAVLEDGLRKIAEANDITVKNNDDLGSLNRRIADKGVYNRIQQQEIQVWNTIRNNADHGKFEEYTSDKVNEMLRGIRKLLATHLSSK